MHLHQAIDMYLKYSYNLSPKTIQIYRDHLNRLMKLDRPLNEIDHWVIIGIINGMHKRNGKPYSPGYLHQFCRTLHAFFGFCQREGWIGHNPMDNVPKPHLDLGPKPRLTLDQIKEMIHTTNVHSLLKTRNLAIILLMVDSGLRLNEVVNLRIMDIRLDDGTVYVANGKMNKCREVPLGNETLTAISNYMAIRSESTSMADIFFRTRSGDPITTGAIHQFIKRIQKRLGVPLHAHLLRKILGHSRIDTTANYYTDPDMTDIINEHKRASPMAQMR